MQKYCFFAALAGLLVSLTPLQAQTRFPEVETPSSNRAPASTAALPAGSSIGLTPGSQPLYLEMTEQQSAVLQVRSAISNNQGQIVIPRGSEVEGTFQPVQGGMQFVARRLVVPDGVAYPISGSSQILKPRPDPRGSQATQSTPAQPDVGSAVGGLLGAGQANQAIKAAGGAAGGTAAKQVVIVSRDEPVELELSRPLQVKAGV